MKLSKKTLYILPVLTALGIFLMSSLNFNNSIDLQISFFDKIAHIIIYFLLTGTILLAFIPNLHNKTTFFIISITFIIASIYALSDEIHQYFVPYRNFDLNDWLADIIGIIISLLLYNFWSFVAKQIINKFEL